MFQLDDNLLQELGLGSLPVADKNKMLGHIYETLELRVGMRLAEQMSDEQLDEFEGFIDRNDEAGALHWLETNFPDYKKVVAEELEKLKNEIKAQAPAILEATRAEMQANAQAQQPQNPYQQPMQPPQNPYQQQQPPQQYPQQPQDPNSGYTQPPQKS
jgi:septum formation inhibitor MinC